MKRSILIILAVLLADQVLKFWVKTEFFLGESLPLFGQGHDWAYLQFVENKGMAFGLEFGGEIGKMALTIFRMLALVVIGYLLWKAIKDKRSAALTVSLSLVFAGALGNIIDSACYGLIFDASTPFQKAVLFPPEGGYAPFLHGAVVDMFYFPLVHGHFPEWLPIWGGEDYEFFRPVFNIADAAISVGIVSLILVQQREDRRSRQVQAPAPASPEDRSNDPLADTKGEQPGEL